MICNIREGNKAEAVQHELCMEFIEGTAESLE